VLLEPVDIVSVPLAERDVLPLATTVCPEVGAAPPGCTSPEIAAANDALAAGALAIVTRGGGLPLPLRGN
jgi:hypothetical protein